MSTPSYPRTQFSKLHFKFTLIFLLLAISHVLSADSYLHESEILMIEPQVRKGTPTTFVEGKGQWGGISQTNSYFAASPNSLADIIWETIHSDKKGVWRIRFSEGFYEEDETYTILVPHSKIVDDDGWFNCGRYSNTKEKREIRFPDVICDLCTLQFQFKTQSGIINQCADVSLLVGENDCEGLWKNGGSCFNGKWYCKTGFGGKYCDGIESMTQQNPSLWLILLIILVIIGFLVLFTFWVIRFVSRKEKGYQKTSPDNTFATEIFEGTIFQDTDNHKPQRKMVNGMYEERLPYRHQKFEDEE